MVGAWLVGWLVWLFLSVVVGGWVVGCACLPPSFLPFFLLVFTAPFIFTFRLLGRETKRKAPASEERANEQVEPAGPSSFLPGWLVLLVGGAWSCRRAGWVMGVWLVVLGGRWVVGWPRWGVVGWFGWFGLLVGGWVVPVFLLPSFLSSCLFSLPPSSSRSVF